MHAYDAAVTVGSGTALPPEVLEALRCPLCEQPLAPSGGAVCCPRRHTFDVAKQGYVNLLPGRAPDNADTPEMLLDRQEFLHAGHYRPVTELVAAHTPTVDGAALVLDAGTGTGHYLRAVLDGLPGAVGLATDVSKHAVRHAVRGNSRIGGAVCDLWRSLPVREGSVSVLLNVFAPRNGAEFRRVLRADGALLAVTPTSRHLAELVEAMDLLSVDGRKLARLDAELDPHLRRARRAECSFELRLSRQEALALVGMGPAGRHQDPVALRARVAALPEPVCTTASVTLSVYQP